MKNLSRGARSWTVKVSELSGVSVSDAGHFRHRIRVQYEASSSAGRTWFVLCRGGWQHHLDDQYVGQYVQVMLDDDLVLHLTKQLPPELPYIFCPSHHNSPQLPIPLTPI